MALKKKIMIEKFIYEFEKFNSVKEYCIEIIKILRVPQENPEKVLEEYINTLPEEIRQEVRKIGYFLIITCSEPAAGNKAIMYLSEKSALKEIREELFTRRIW